MADNQPYGSKSAFLELLPIRVPLNGHFSRVAFLDSIQGCHFANGCLTMVGSRGWCIHGELCGSAPLLPPGPFGGGPKNKKKNEVAAPGEAAHIRRRIILQTPKQTNTLANKPTNKISEQTKLAAY